MKKVISCLALIILIIACKKSEVSFRSTSEIATTENENTLNKNLIVTTHAVTPTSAIQAFIIGDISVNGGGNSIRENGFCYSVSPGPTIYSDTVHGSPYFLTGWFSGLIEGLTPGTTYHVKAYGMKNNGDVYYGNEVSFTTLTIGEPGPGIGIVTDIDGNVYHTISYGSQVWMVENLKTTHYRDGTPIPNVTDSAAWSSLTTDAYCDYDNIPSNAVDYGRLYNWYAASDTRNIAPTGWHVPGFLEMQNLFYYLGGGGIAGGRMKETGFSHWLSPNSGADNSSGFTAVGAGQRNEIGGFYGLKIRNGLWCLASTMFTAFYLEYNSNSYHYSLGACHSCFKSGFAIRCIKD